MAKKSASAARPLPLTLDLSATQIAKIEQARKQLGLDSISDVVRHAIESYDPSRFTDSAEEHRQISVRIPAQAKTALAKAAKKNKVSVANLVRAAIDNLPAKKGKK
ncbi:CopG family transcriptional regulator [Opitutaceae bacterium TAV4]|uniref:hypothetical protein n=1 Tax=Geminisphaera colitermitum TaxID=1148786 RepID=UPI000158D5A5|nr:hypothetical protein [Geminisphaera colitermitum]RRJ95523.1 CopG family transcriptional regulator [Opitutaceae bacterium TAV4]RRJ99831.1 CopG family transcriptional regulator [Opitutaceae bacterium TAV3]